MNFEKLGISKKMFSTILLWSCYDGYYSISEIAEALKISKNTVMSRVKGFAKKYPETYRKILGDRQAIKHTMVRHRNALSKPESFSRDLNSPIREMF